MTNLFHGEDRIVSEEKTTQDQHAPLAWRMRPRELSEFVGQSHLLGPGKILRRAIEADRISSLILYGPPGCGKTGLARIIACRTRAVFRELNAVTSGVQEIRQILTEARHEVSVSGRGILLFVDEIHRFNRSQQSALLPDIERGGVILIGASTVNPSFALIPALSSRSRIYEFRSLSEEDLKILVARALMEQGRGLGGMRVVADGEVLHHLITASEGDARKALSALETAVLTTPPNERGEIVLDLETAQACSGKKILAYGEDAHFDTISAFIKSMRGSDPDAAVYWLAKMIYAGEDPIYIARRMIICAAEDVGNADPMALPLAVATLHAVEAIGMPEGRIPLSQAALYLACAPKSNASYLAIGQALEDVEKLPSESVPPHLQDSHYPGAKRLGRGEGYRYPHEFPDHYVDQFYGVKEGRYYQPSHGGYERKIKSRLEKLKKRQT
jgi:putative ATPase